MSEKAYIGSKPCGCVVAMHLMSSTSAPDAVADMARDGLNISTIPADEARLSGSCKHVVEYVDESPCPDCGSFHIHIVRHGTSGRDWKCDTCGHRWLEQYLAPVPS